MKDNSVYHLLSYWILPQLDSFLSSYFSDEEQEEKNELRKLFEKIFLWKWKYTDKELLEFFQFYIDENIEDKNERKEVKENLNSVFSNEKQKVELRTIIEENKDSLGHLLHWYELLKDVNKIELDIESLTREIEEIKLKLYVEDLNLDKASSYIQDKVQSLELKIKKLENEKELLLNSKEVIAAYEFHKITNYAALLHKWQIVETPTVKQQKKIILDKIASGQTVLLSWPVWTWKTKMAKNLYLMILKEKLKSNQISDEEYEQLKAIPIVNGNEETTVRELNSRPVQMSNRTDEKEAFKYEIWLVIKCLKYGLPLIIDEANRTPVNFLSALKSYWSMTKGEVFKDPITWEYFEVKGPLQVILTANEWDKYIAHTQKFQDQIEREISREYIWYLPEDEMFDLLKAKTYKAPWISFLTPEDLSKVLPNLINSVMEINEMYLKWEKYKEWKWEISQLENKSTVFDIKRFLELVKTSKIDSKETFLEEINESIVSFISHDVNSDDERKVLCWIFHKNCLLWNENIPDLVVWNTKLSEQDLVVWVSTKKEQVLNTVYWPQIQDRFLNSWDFSVWYWKLINLKTKSWVESHRLAKFNDLAWEDSETKLNHFIKSVNWLFHAVEDKEIIDEFQNMTTDQFDEVSHKALETLMSKEDSDDKILKLKKFKKALEVYDKSRTNDLLLILNKLVESDAKSENDKNKPSLESATLYPVFSTIVEDFAKEEWAWRGLNQMKKIADVIKVMKDKELIKYENKDGWILTSITIGPRPIRWFEPDLSNFSDVEDRTSSSYTYANNNISKNEVYLSWIRGPIDTWTNKKLSDYVASLKEDNLTMISKEKLLWRFDELRIYISKYYGLELSWLDTMDAFFWMLGTIGLFWTSDYHKNATRSCVLYCNDFRSLQAYWHDQANASILLSDY